MTTTQLIPIENILAQLTIQECPDSDHALYNATNYNSAFPEKRYYQLKYYPIEILGNHFKLRFPMTHHGDLFHTPEVKINTNIEFQYYFTIGTTKIEMPKTVSNSIPMFVMPYSSTFLNIEFNTTNLDFIKNTEMELNFKFVHLTSDIRWKIKSMNNLTYNGKPIIDGAYTQEYTPVIRKFLMLNNCTSLNNSFILPRDAPIIRNITVFDKNSVEQTFSLAVDRDIMPEETQGILKKALPYHLFPYHEVSLRFTDQEMKVIQYQEEDWSDDNLSTSYWHLFNVGLGITHLI